MTSAPKVNEHSINCTRKDTNRLLITEVELSPMKLWHYVESYHHTELKSGHCCGYYRIPEKTSSFNILRMQWNQPSIWPGMTRHKLYFKEQSAHPSAA